MSKSNDNIKEVGLKFTVEDGVVFQKTIKEIKSDMNLASVEFQKATSAMDKNKDSLQILMEKQKLYQKQIELQKQKLNILNGELEKLQENEEKNAEAISKKKIEIAKTETQLNKYQRSLDDINKKLSEQTLENEKLEKNLKDLEKELNQIEAEYNKTISALDKNATATEKLTAKQQLLQSQTEKQTAKVDDLKRQLELLTDSEEENEEAISNKKLELTKAETELNNYQKELKETSEELSKHTQITDKITTKLNDISDRTINIGKKMSVVSASIIAMGTACKSAFDEVDDGMDRIIKATGASGETADMLERVYHNVSEEIVGDFSEIGGAIGEINTRFGFTGGVLNNASKDFLKFAELNNTEVVSAVQLVSRAMGDANIDSSEYASVLDALTIAAQASGISIDVLTGNITKYGAPMRALGYDTKESIAIFASWEKAGVNTEIAFSGMKKAISNFSSQGKDAKIEFRKTLEEIKKCPDIASATTKAIEVFGAKAGPDLADAIKGGRFEFSEMLEVIKNSDGIVQNTFEDLKDGSYEAELAMQNSKISMADIGNTLMEILAPILQKISEKLQGFSESWRNLSPTIQKIIVIIAMIIATIGPLLLMIGGISAGISALITGITALSAPILIIIGIITALISIFAYLWNTNEEFRDNMLALWQSIQTIFSLFLDWLGNVFGAGFNEKFGFFKEILNAFKVFLSEIINSSILLFRGLLDFLIGVFTGDWQLAFSGLENILNGFYGIVDSILSFIQNIFVNLLTWLSGIFLTDWSKYFGMFGDIVNGFSVTISGIINSIKMIFSGMIDFITGIFTGNWERAWQGIVSIFSRNCRWVRNNYKSTFKFSNKYD